MRRVLLCLALLAATVVARAEDERAAATAAFRAGRWTEAAALYERFAGKDEKDVVAWLRLSMCRLELGEIEPARAALAHAVAVEGRRARLEFADGRIAVAAGDFEGALRGFGAGRKKNAAYEPTWTAQNLGYVLYRLGRFAEARVEFATVLARPATELAPRMFVNAAQNELALGAAPAACAMLEKGRAQFPDDKWLADEHGWALKAAGDRGGAAKAYARARELAATGAPAAAVVVALPMHATLRVVQGRNGAFSHEGLRSCEAVDLVVVGEDGTETRPDGKRNEDHASFGLPVLAAMDGDVVAVNDGVADNVPGEMNLVATRGNFVYLRHGPGLFTRYFHLEKGSIQVRVGAHVRRGEPIGSCGNSGFSTRPHLCFAVACAPPELDVAIPFRFGPCVETKDGRSAAADAVVPDEGVVVAPPK